MRIPHPSIDSTLPYYNIPISISILIPTPPLPNHLIPPIHPHSIPIKSQPGRSKRQCIHPINLPPKDITTRPQPSASLKFLCSSAQKEARGIKR